MEFDPPTSLVVKPRVWQRHFPRELCRPREDDEDAQALHALNCKLATDPRVECVLLPFADGIQICRKR